MRPRINNEAVSEIVGTVLLLAMAICLFSLLSIIVLSYPISASTPSANLVYTIEGDCLFIEHRGGTPLRLDTKVLLSINDESIRIGDFLDDKAKDDNLWGIGEWFIYQNVKLKNQKVTISIVDVESNCVIMTGSLQGT
jgi:flagellin-like protein